MTNLETISENRIYYDLNQAFGYIIEIPSENLTIGDSVSVLEIRIFKQKKTNLINFLKGLLSVTISNGLYSAAYNLNATVQSSIMIDSAVSTNNPIRPGTNYSFEFIYTSLGEPSCAMISIKNEKKFTIGTTSSLCSTQFDTSIEYFGRYTANASVWFFKYQLNTIGEKQLKEFHYDILNLITL